MDETVGRKPDTGQFRIVEMRGHQSQHRYDELAAEEPLELRVLKRKRYGYTRHSIAITMRTPGHDFELATGFLLSEGVVSGRNSIASISYCTNRNEIHPQNIVEVQLAERIPFDLSKLSRHVYSTSSCGICGMASIDLVRAVCKQRPEGTFQISENALLKLPLMLRNSQNIFSRTGGLHASALFDTKGRLLIAREDVGRHNALDKLVGSLLLSGSLPASNTVLVVSGRASFELVQKAVVAGIPFIAAVGAPSTLAVELAREYAMTLVGFLRRGRFNVYSGFERIKTSYPAHRKLSFSRN